MVPARRLRPGRPVRLADLAERGAHPSDAPHGPPRRRRGRPRLAVPPRRDAAPACARGLPGRAERRRSGRTRRRRGRADGGRGASYGGRDRPGARRTVARPRPPRPGRDGGRRPRPDGPGPAPGAVADQGGRAQRRPLLLARPAGRPARARRGRPRGPGAGPPLSGRPRTGRHGGPARLVRTGRAARSGGRGPRRTGPLPRRAGPGAARPPGRAAPGSGHPRAGALPAGLRQRDPRLPGARADHRRRTPRPLGRRRARGPGRRPGLRHLAGGRGRGHGGAVASPLRGRPLSACRLQALVLDVLGPGASAARVRAWRREADGNCQTGPRVVRPPQPPASAGPYRNGPIWYGSLADMPWEAD